jgi:hypothetical protein
MPGSFINWEFSVSTMILTRNKRVREDLFDCGNSGRRARDGREIKGRPTGGRPRALRTALSYAVAKVQVTKISRAGSRLRCTVSSTIVGIALSWGDMTAALTPAAQSSAQPIVVGIDAWTNSLGLVTISLDGCMPARLLPCGGRVLEAGWGAKAL